MNPCIERLYKIAMAKQRYIIGLMSGTSLDGLDIAYGKFAGSGRETSVEILAFDTIPYSKEFKENILKIFAQPMIDFPFLAILHEWIGIQHASMVNQFLQTHQIDKAEVDLIASHGQTVMHAPARQHGISGFPDATMQIGDGDHIALHTGIITLSDFRQKHLAAGGEGAPLAVYGDYLMFSKEGENRIMLNIGGIANFTYLPESGHASDVFVSDTGPGNTLMDAYMQSRYHLPYDSDANIANKGKVHTAFLNALKSHRFFRMQLPKTTGPEIFNLKYVQDALQHAHAGNISDEDIMATLNRFSAETIAEAILKVIGDRKCNIYVSGGGAHNPLLMSSLKPLLSACRFDFADVLGIPGDAKEAVLFAVLANETIAGNPVDFGSNTGIPGICMGKISLPQ